MYSSLLGGGFLLRTFTTETDDLGGRTAQTFTKSFAKNLGHKTKTGFFGFRNLFSSFNFNLLTSFLEGDGETGNGDHFRDTGSHSMRKADNRRLSQSIRLSLFL